MKRLFVATLVALVALLALGAVMAVAAPPSPGTAESFGAVQNTSNTVANVTIDYYNGSSQPNYGTIRASRSVTVSPKATQGLAPRLLDGTAQALPAGWVGSAIVSSDQEVVAVSYVNWTGGSPFLSPDQKTSADYGGISAPATSILFPSVSNADNEATSLVIQNAGSTSAKAYVSYFDRNGAPKGKASTASIPAGAQATVELSGAGLPANFLGSVVVTSTNPLAGVAIAHWAVSYGSYAYDAEPTTGGATSLYFPKASRRAADFNAGGATDCGAHTGGWYDYSGIVIQNTSQSAQANVKVHFYNRAGTEITAALVTDTIPQFSSHGYNTRFNANASPTAMAALGCNFLGSVMVESTNGTPIVGILKQGWEAEKWASGYNGIAGTAAGTSLYYPYFYHTNNNYTPNPTGDGSPWAQWTGLIVQNVDTTGPVTVYVNILGRDGSVVKSFKDTATIGTNAAHGYNARYDASVPGSTFASLPFNFTGGAYITATGKIVGLMSTWNMFGGDVNETLAFPK